MRKLFIALLAVPVLLLATTASAGDRYHGGGYHGGWGGHGHGSWHGHSYFGVQIGVPLIWPRPAYYGVNPYAYPYQYPYAYPATQVVVERQPQVYVQREVAQSAPAQSTDAYWYYCPDSKTYYPYAKTCPTPWLQVVPQTSPQGAN